MQPTAVPSRSARNSISSDTSDMVSMRLSSPFPVRPETSTYGTSPPYPSKWIPSAKSMLFTRSYKTGLSDCWGNIWRRKTYYICLGLVHLVDGNHKPNIPVVLLHQLNNLSSLRHYAIISSDDQHDNIRAFCTPSSHSRKRCMTRSI